MSENPSSRDQQGQGISPRESLSCDSQATLAPATGPEILDFPADFGEYLLLEEIARGGMGVVYRARQKTIGRVVALKMILAGQMASSSEVARFHREARAAANLDHPNILPIYEVGEHHGRHYFTMKLVEEGNLAGHIPDLVEHPRESARIVALIAHAVHHAHLRGVIHRDLKPANVLLETGTAFTRAVPAGGFESATEQVRKKSSGKHLLRPLVTDFGLARPVDQEAHLTTTGAILGTPSYMSPEQATGCKALTTATDVYALGAILYDCLTGQPPFRGATVLETLVQVTQREPVHPCEIRESVNRDLAIIALKCLEKDPARRYGSAETLAEDLERWQRDEPILARPAGNLERCWRWCQRRPGFAVMAFLIGIAFLASQITILALYQHIRTQQDLLVAEHAMVERQRKQVLAQEQISQERRWRLLQEQARASRLSGWRWRSLELQAEAGRIRTTPELTTAVIETLTEPGIRLVAQLGPKNLSIVGDGKYVSFHPDGSMLAAADSPGSGFGDEGPGGVSVWELPSGNRLARTGDVQSQSGFVFAPTEKILALAGQQRLRLWDPVENRTRWSCAGTSPVCFDPTGKLLAATLQKSVILRRAADGQPVPLEARGVPVAFLSAETLLVRDGASLVLWNVATGKQLGRTPADSVPVGHGSTLARDGSLVVLQELGNKGFLIWDMARSKIVSRHADLVRSGRTFMGTGMPVSNHASLLAVSEAGLEGSIRLRDLRENKPPLGLLTPPGFVKTALQMGAFSPDGSLLAAGEEGNVVRIWDVRAGQSLSVLDGHRDPVWSENGRYLATFGPGSSDVSVHEVEIGAPRYVCPRSVRVLLMPRAGKDVLAGESTWRIVRHGDHFRLAPQAMNATLTGSLVVQAETLWVARFEKRLQLERLYPDPALYDLDQQDRANRHFVVTYAVRPDGKRLLVFLNHQVPLPGQPGVSTVQAVLEEWDLQARKRVPAWSDLLAGQDHYYLLAYSPNNRFLLISSASRALTLRDAETGKVLRVVEMVVRQQGSALNLLPRMVAFSADGRLAYLGCQQGWVVRVDLLTGQTEHWRVLTGDLTAIALNPDSGLLACSGQDRTLALFDPSTGQVQFSWPTGQQGVTALAFSADGRVLISGAEDGTLRVWEIDRIRKGLADLQK